MISYLLQIVFLFLTVAFLINHKDNIIDNINSIIHKENFSNISNGITIGLIFYTAIIALVIYLLLPRGIGNSKKDLSPSVAFIKSNSLKKIKKNLSPSAAFMKAYDLKNAIKI